MIIIPSSQAAGEVKWVDTRKVLRTVWHSKHSLRLAVIIFTPISNTDEDMHNYVWN